MARLPDDLMESFFSAEGRAGAERGMANMGVLRLTKGYVRDAGAWDTDIRTPTRLADDPRTTLRLARLRDGRIEPYALDEAPDELWRAWRLSEVAVSARRVGGEAAPPENLAEALREAKATWSRYDADKILVVLGEGAAADAPWSGSAMSAATGPKEVILGYESAQRSDLRCLTCRTVQSGRCVVAVGPAAGAPGQVVGGADSRRVNPSNNPSSRAMRSRKPAMSRRNACWPGRMTAARAIAAPMVAMSSGDMADLR